MIEMQNITKYYGNFRALNNISFSIEKGEVIGFLGPNGAGKTTAMRILTTFLPPSSGTATIAGFDVFDESYEVRRRIGYLPETPPLYPEMTVETYLNFVGEIKELSRKIRKNRIVEIAERVGLKDYLKRIIGHLSKGFQQRVGIAQALLHNPEVLILDEPTVGLDPNQIIEIRNLIKDLSKDHTIILSTHYLAEVSMTCNRAIIINDGEIVAIDTVDNLEKKACEKTAWDILLKPDDSGKTLKILDELPEKAIIDRKDIEGLIKFRLELSSENEFDKFFAKVSSSGGIFRQIAPVRATLEDVFIKLTQNEERKNKA